MNEFSLSHLPAEQLSGPAPFILQQLDLYNWGSFHGRHTVEIDPCGTAIIGPTGSGKTTLVDALMTLLTAQPKYNLASTGGHESDRDLMSYLRGVTGAGNQSGDNEHILRKQKTITGISARFFDGGKTIQLGAILWVDNQSFAASDRKDLWIYSEREDQSLDAWLTLFNEGGSRALKQLSRETEHLFIEGTKKTYLARVRRCFEVGENAFNLLNRAAGLKQLNSIDQVFRELVLDERAFFHRAAEVATEFDNLAAIHNELEIARKQRESLLPIYDNYKKYQNLETQIQHHKKLLEIIPIWFALAAHQLWQARAAQRQHELAEEAEKLAEQNQNLQQQQATANNLKEIYLQAGGNSIEHLKARIEDQTQKVSEKQQHAQDYKKLMRALGMDDSLNATSLQQNQTLLKQQEADLKQTQHKQDDVTAKCTAGHVGLQDTVKGLQEEIDKVSARPGSNLPSGYTDFRALLAQTLALNDADLPYVAELAEVKSTEHAWRGAIERAIGGHRLRLLVPSRHLQAALDWINARDNRLHVRLLEAKAELSPAQFLNDGFTRKLNYKKHPLCEALKYFVAGIDRHCVASPQELRNTPHAMTAQGLMSGGSGKYEKQDQKRLEQDWMTGFDNRDRLRKLQVDLDAQQQHLSRAQQDLAAAKKALQETQDQLRQLQLIKDLDFDSIDLPGAQAHLENLQQQMTALCDPNSSVGKARQEYERIETQIDALLAVIKDLERQYSQIEFEIATIEKSREQAYQQIGAGLDDTQMALGDEHLPEHSALNIEALLQTERDTRTQCEQQRERLAEKFHDLGKRMVNLMAKAKQVDTGVLTEAGVEIIDVPTYLDRLDTLNNEALPEKLQRFLAYLNQSSDQGVTQLLADIDNEVSLIEERIQDLNQTLQRVDFQPKRFLQLIPNRVVHQSLKNLQKAQNQLRHAALSDDEGETHFRALEHMVTLLRDAADNKRTIAAQALLDPRYRLQFAVSVIERDSQKVIETRTGSQGGSGGEKEIIASYILTASLSYALCPPGATRPMFGSIVLDEAFSKSSHAVAGRIISALNEFGLHALFVTPNKEMRLLRDHTRSAILVHRKQLHSSLTTLSWEKLAAHAKQHAQQNAQP